MPLKTLIAILSLCVSAFAQHLPDTPMPQLEPRISNPFDPLQPPVPAFTCGRFHWSCWGYPNVPTKEVIKSKAFWATFLGDVAISSFDAEMSHAGLAHRRCGEANGNTSRWQLYRSNLPENAAVGVVSFIWLKVKGPRYVMPAFLARPAYVHIKAGMQWYDQCW